jgi:hypothetical protein
VTENIVAVVTERPLAIDGLMLLDCSQLHDWVLEGEPPKHSATGDGKYHQNCPTLFPQATSNIIGLGLFCGKIALKFIETIRHMVVTI